MSDVAAAAWVQRSSLGVGEPVDIASTRVQAFLPGRRSRYAAALSAHLRGAVLTDPSLHVEARSPRLGHVLARRAG